MTGASSGTGRKARLTWVPGMRRSRALLLILVAIVATLVAALAVPARAQSQREVDEARARQDAAARDLRERQDEEQFVEDELDAILLRYEQVNDDLDRVRARIEKFESRVIAYQTEIDLLRDEAIQLALEAYMQGNTDVGFFEADTFDELVTSQEVAKLATEETLDRLRGFDSVQRDMERVQAQIDADNAELEVLAADEAELLGPLSVLLAKRAEQREAAAAVLADASAEYKAAVAAWEAEKLRRRLAEIARRKGASAGIPGGNVPGMICPVKGGAAFINSWGFPRSGGRTHKGTDMFAPRGTPLVAVDSGVVQRSSNRLGGINVWLIADHGIAYYYAHLDRWSNVGSGERVSKGTTIGFLGNSGNARGTSPHLHIQMHPGGRSARPVNPYATMVHACR